MPTNDLTHKGGTKKVYFTGADIKSINIEPDLGEVQFRLKDGRLARIHMRKEGMKLLLSEVNVTKDTNKWFDIIDKYGS
jgi:hypothetical protein